MILITLEADQLGVDQRVANVSMCARAVQSEGSELSINAVTIVSDYDFLF